MVGVGIHTPRELYHFPKAIENTIFFNEHNFEYKDLDYQRDFITNYNYMMDSPTVELDIDHSTFYFNILSQYIHSIFIDFIELFTHLNFRDINLDIIKQEITEKIFNKGNIYKFQLLNLLS